MLTSAEQLAKKFNEAFPKSRAKLQDQEIAAACGVSKQAVVGWRDTGRIAKKHLPVLSRLSNKELIWWIPGTETATKEGHRKASTETQNIIDRLISIESSGASSPQLLTAIAAVLDLIAPNASADGYAGLEKIKSE